MTLKYRSPSITLPPADSLPFPGNLVRLCESCGLRQGCRAPVPGEGPMPADVMLVGQNPGFNEDQQGRPFIGQAGHYLDSLLFQAGVPRETVYITNLCKCLSPNNRELKPDEVSACASWFDLELDLVRPRIVVAMGAPAIARFLGSGAGTVEHLHARPVEVDGRIILPAYHPAAALHNPTLLRQCQEDFQVLRGLVKGRDAESFHAKDEYPSPDYQVADSDAKVYEMVSQLIKSGEYAIDTEICRGKLWSCQVSTYPGTAWFVPVRADARIDATSFDALAVMHNYLFDINYVRVRDDRFTDTMVMAYLLGLPQGLKDLASRICGVKMVNYNEVVRPGQQKLALDYLARASSGDWPDPPKITETKWNNRKGELVTRTKKPWHISRKLDKLMGDYSVNTETDLWDRWRSIPEEERSVVESVLGPMPESSLVDIPFSDAVVYACRDADVTLRVYHKLRKMISDLELDFVLDMDTRILPMVYDMMRNGMAVDLDHFRKLSEEYDTRLQVKSYELAGMVGHSFNPASSLQVASVIYQELGFKPTKTTPTGEISTDDQELKKTKSPVATEIIRYRGLQKLRTAYADPLVEKAVPDPDGVPRVHTTLKTTRVETGRLSSSDPNLQNIPTRNKESKAIKNGFIAAPGKILAEGDYSQIEMCTLAHLTRCTRLIELFARGGDPHTEMAARIFGVSLDEAAKSKYRYPVKRLNFGIAYLIGPKGLSNQIQEYISDLEMEGEPVEIEPWDEPTCERFIDDWYQLNPEVKDFQLEMAAMARRYGYVRDMFGRIRYIPEVSCPIRSVQEAGARQAANMPITGSAQGIIKLAMGKLWEDLPKTEWADRARFLMQIHDSLIAEVDDREEIYRPYLTWMKDVMCSVVQLRVPVKVDFKVGTRWGSLEKIKL